MNDDNVRAENARLAQDAAERNAQRYRMQLRFLVDTIGANPRALSVLANLICDWQRQGTNTCAAIAEVWAMGSGALMFSDEKMLQGSVKTASQMGRDFRMMEIERYDAQRELQAACDSLGLDVRVE